MMRTRFIVLALLAVALAAWVVVGLWRSRPPPAPPVAATGGMLRADAAAPRPSAARAATASRQVEAERRMVAWREEFDRRKPSASPTPPARGLLLESMAVDTSRDAGGGWRTAGLAPGARPWRGARPQSPTPRQTYPFLVQLDGPPDDARKAALAAAGAILRGYLPEDGFLFEAPESALDAVAALPFVTWVGDYLPAYKLEPFLRDAVARAAAGAGGDLAVAVQTLAPQDVAGVAARIRDAGGAIEAAAPGRRWGLVRAALPAGRIAELTRIGAVQWIEAALPRVLFNDVAAGGGRLNVTNVWTTYGLTGAGQIIGHADTGLDVGTTNGLPPDFAGRLLAAFALGRPGNWSDPQGHGTHTAGSIVGTGARSAGQYRGIAHGAKLVHQSLLDSGGGLGGLPADLYDLFAQTYDLGARFHSDSWGSPVGGQYTSDSRQCDEFTWDHPDMLLVFAAGNSGRDYDLDGVVDLDSIGAPGTAKNTLTVGASESGRAAGTGGYTSGRWGTYWPLYYPAAPLAMDYISQSADGIRQGLAAFSSRGPTDDGRTKPDLVAPGTDVISVRSRQFGATTGWGLSPNSDYMFYGGTSMATPLAAGAAALVRQYWVERRGLAAPGAALIKATLLNGARSLQPGQYGEGEGQEIPSGPRPNNAEGWGQIDVERTLFPPPPLALVAVSGTVGTRQTNEFPFVALTSAPLRVTLAWMDFPATAGALRKLVNDVDVALVDPTGGVHYASGAPAPDRSNTVEGLEVEVAEAGEYRLIVAGHSVPQGPQPYDVILRGAIALRPVIEHEPLTNTLSSAPYEVRARVDTHSPFSPDRADLRWRVGSTGAFARLSLEPQGSNWYRAFIPGQPQFTEVNYYLEAGIGALATADPADAPATVHRFDVTIPATLTVQGTPSAVGAVAPPYGAAVFASGNLVRASAPAVVPVSPLVRLACDGWNGTGAVPDTGATNALSFRIGADSRLTWRWAAEYALRQVSSVTGFVDTTTWWRQWDLAGTVTAPPVGEIEGERYRFAQWMLDGLRQPDPTNRAANPVTDLLMLVGHEAEAVYLPETLDADADGLGDWWEYFHFGSRSPAPGEDGDGDGFTNLKEFQDLTDPRNDADAPTPPWIAHTPIPDPAPAPAPWTLTAAVTDNAAVASVLLAWSRNGGVWQTSILEGVSGTYAGTIPAPGTNGDTFVYRIEARDGSGLRSVSGPYTFQVRHPVLRLSPAELPRADFFGDGSTQLVFSIFNDGEAALDWQAAVESQGLNEDCESGARGWTHEGPYDVWHLEGGRVQSGQSAWHFGNGPGGAYPDSAHAWLVTPPTDLGPGAELSFRQWADFEYDTDQQDNHFWDGAVVELSTNDGADYLMLDPVGGYPYRITDNPASPFPPETPCLAGTGGWETVRFDLSAFAGHTVRIRFRFGADAYVTREGWYLDDIRITPLDAPDSWVRLPVAWGSVSPHGRADVAVDLTVQGLPPGGSRSAAVRLYHNAPGAVSNTPVTVLAHDIRRRLSIAAEGPGTASPTGGSIVAAGFVGAVRLQADPYSHVHAVCSNGVTNVWAGLVAATNVALGPVETDLDLRFIFDINTTTNGVPESWLAAYGLTNGTPDSEAAGDGDGDGKFTWQEYYERTDPTNAASVFFGLYSIRSVGDPPTGVELRWMAFSNTAYRYVILSYTNLLEPPEDLTGGGLPGNPMNVYIDYTGGPKRFYHLRRVR